MFAHALNSRIQLVTRMLGAQRPSTEGWISRVQNSNCPGVHPRLLHPPLCQTNLLILILIIIIITCLFIIIIIIIISIIIIIIIIVAVTLSLCRSVSVCAHAIGQNSRRHATRVGNPMGATPGDVCPSDYCGQSWESGFGLSWDQDPVLSVVVSVSMLIGWASPNLATLFFLRSFSAAVCRSLQRKGPTRGPGRRK